MRLRYLVWYRGGIDSSTLLGAFPSANHAAVFVVGQRIPAERLVLVDAVTHAHRSCRELLPAPRLAPAGGADIPSPTTRSGAAPTRREERGRPDHAPRLAALPRPESAAGAEGRP